MKKTIKKVNPAGKQGWRWICGWGYRKVLLHPLNKGIFLFNY